MPGISTERVRPRIKKSKSAGRALELHPSATLSLHIAAFPMAITTQHDACYVYVS